MDPRDTQSSFIPKHSLTAADRHRPPTVGLFSLVSTLIFVVSLLFLGGAYAFKFFLSNEINRPCTETDLTSTANCGLAERLERVHSNLQNDLILDFRNKDAKMKAAWTILEEHRTILPILKFLEDYTLKTVSYTRLDFHDDELTMAGVAKSYESIALQSDLFQNSPKLVDTFLFSELRPDAAGRVSFSLKIKLRPGITDYQNYLDSLNTT